MNTYIALVNWTQKGIQEFKDSGLLRYQRRTRPVSI